MSIDADIAAAARPTIPESVAARARRDESALHILRLAYAKALEQKFLDAGVDVRVSCRDARNTTLHLSYVLAGRVFVHQLDRSDMIPTAIKLGFKRVEVFSSNGLEASWTL